MGVGGPAPCDCATGMKRPSHLPDANYVLRARTPDRICSPAVQKKFFYIFFHNSERNFNFERASRNISCVGKSAWERVGKLRLARVKTWHTFIVCE